MSIKFEFKIKCLKCNQEHATWQEYIDCLLAPEKEKSFGESIIEALKEALDHERGKTKLKESLVKTTALPKSSFGKKRSKKKQLPNLKRKKKKK